MIHYPELRDLQLLLALARRKHFTLAALDCGISQPAFSARIRGLEQQLGVPIVRRGNKFLGFTKDGELVLAWAHRLLADAEGLRQDVEIAKGELSGVLVLGVVPTALTFAAAVSTQLRLAHPKLVMQILSMTSAQIARGLNDFSLDAGLTYDDGKELAALSFEPVYKERYVLLSPAALAPKKRGSISWKSAARLPLCLLHQDMRFRQILDAVFQTAGVTPEPVMETNALTTVLARVNSGTAATIAPQKLVESMVKHSDLVCLKLTEPVVEHAIGLATVDYQPSLPTINALRETLRKAS